MKIKSVHVRDFKRFADLRVTDIPERTRMVVLVGPNGSGKSSLFEAFNFWTSQVRGGEFRAEYHWRTGSNVIGPQQSLYERIDITFHDDRINRTNIGLNQRLVKKAFYLRSAYRHESEVSSQNPTALLEMIEDQGRPSLLIRQESRVSDNYRRLVAEAVNELFAASDDSLPIRDVRDRLIGRIRQSMHRLFGDLDLVGLGRSVAGGTFLFDKGESKKFDYFNLSGGERAAFDLILDFVVKTQTFDDTVFCLDEPELHMHTRLQSTLLGELYRVLPEGCQLWIATHSIGMLRCAMELHRDRPGEVVFLDFEGKDFDSSVVLQPADVDRQFWRRMFAGALDDLAELVAPSEVVFCEGKPESPGGAGTGTFDAAIYRTLFRRTHPSTEFIALGGANDVEKNSALLGTVFGRLFSTMKVWRLLDRDDRSEIEAEEALRTGGRLLRRRDLESYLWDDEILTKLCEQTGNIALTEDILSYKAELLRRTEEDGRSVDDVKSIGGRLYVEVKKRLRLTGCGNTAEEFCKATLAPLVTPDTCTYKELDADIFE